MIVVCGFVCVSVVESNVCGSDSLAEVGRTGVCDGQGERGDINMMADCGVSEEFRDCFQGVGCIDVRVHRGSIDSYQL